MSATIGRYEIERSLTGGGMADVYLARDPNFDRVVVVKVIKSEFSSNSEFRARFSREARVIARLEHEAIVPVYDFGEHNGQPYIVMRYMTGPTLAERLESGPLPLPEAAGVVGRVADALDYAHSRGIIHRDLKPGNILFDDRGHAYLSDFGIAKLDEGPTNLTGTAILGTPAYMSPEQAQAMQDLDKRSDVYSLGVMVFEMLTGKLPFRARDALGMVFANVNEPVPDIRKVRSDLPRESDTFIRRAMAKKPDDRYQSTGELARDFNKLAARPSAKPGPLQWPPPKAEVPYKTPPKPKTPPAEQSATLLSADSLDVSGPPGPDKPRRLGWLWAVPVALVAVCALAALAAGIIALPDFYSQKTPAPTQDSVAIITTSAPTTTRASAESQTAASNAAPTEAPTEVPIIEIKIAFFGPLTGPASSLGQEQLALARLAVDDFNKTMAGFHATMVEEDTDITADKAVPVCQKDADDASILAVVGPSGSGQVKACADILEKAGLVHVSGSATNPALSTAGYKTFFRVVPNDDVQGATDGNYIADKLGLKKVYLISDKEAYGDGLVAVVDKILKDKGVETAVEGVDQKDSDFSALVTKIKAFNAELVFFAGQVTSQGTLMAKQLKEQGLNIPIFGGDGFYSQKDYIDDAGGATEGSYASVFFPDVHPIPEAAALVAAADKAFPSWGNFGAATYVATTVVLEAAAKASAAGHLDRAGVLDAVSKTDTKVFGMPYKFDGTGEVVGASFVVSQVKAGKFSQVYP